MRFVKCPLGVEVKVWRMTSYRLYNGLGFLVRQLISAFNSSYTRETD